MQCNAMPCHAMQLNTTTNQTNNIFGRQFGTRCLAQAAMLLLLLQPYQGFDALSFEGQTNNKQTNNKQTINETTINETTMQSQSTDAQTKPNKTQKHGKKQKDKQNFKT